MEKEKKVAEAPGVEEPEAAAEVVVEESLIDNRRAEIEKLVITENETIPEPEVDSETLPKEEKKEEIKVAEDDPLERIKKSVQKRIDKVVAQKKSVEEELAETKAELTRLKASPKSPETVPDKKEDGKEPTPEQVESYIIKMREEGNVKEEIAATRYLIKLEKELALKEVRDEQIKTQKESEAKNSKELADWTDLSKDYLAYDETGKLDAKSDLNLSNQNGLLYKTALALYNDKELHADFYDNPNVMQGFRRAVADAYREIHQQGLLKQTPKGTQIVTEKRTPRQALAEPNADSPEESPSPNINSNSLSDAEKVREEIKARNKNRFKR